MRGLWGMGDGTFDVDTTRNDGYGQDILIGTGDIGICV